jgi:sulfopyruvate decarboxylase TPP-binding subunit
MKAKEFWEFLCEEVGYRFFAGVPCKGLKPLYDSMHPRFMHYIPAVRESVALALSSGAEIVGTKAAVLMSEDRIYSVLDYIVSFNKPYGVSPLILAYSEKENKEIINILQSHNIPYMMVEDVNRDINILIEKVSSSNLPGIAILRKGVVV